MIAKKNFFILILSFLLVQNRSKSNNIDPMAVACTTVIFYLTYYLYTEHLKKGDCFKITFTDGSNYSSLSATKVLKLTHPTLYNFQYDNTWIFKFPKMFYKTELRNLLKKNKIKFRELEFCDPPEYFSGMPGLLLFGIKKPKINALLINKLNVKDFII